MKARILLACAFVGATAAAAWIICYGLAAYSFGEAFADVASPAAVCLGLAAALIVLTVPALILRYEKRLLAEAELLPRTSLGFLPADSVAQPSRLPSMLATCPSTPPVPSR